VFSHPSGPRRSGLLAVGLLLVLIVAGTASSGSALEMGTIKAKVQYPDGAGVFHPLAGVEVIVTDGNPDHNTLACTNANGVATFHIPAGSGIMAATGPSLSSKQCANGEFLEPGTGLKLYAVYYKQHHGVAIWDTFELAPGQTLTIQFKTRRPPADQNLVCGGHIPTILGTAGPDTLVGTAAADIISGGGGNDVIKGLGNATGDIHFDILCGGPGRDRILGGAGDDALFGEADDDGGGTRGLFGGEGSDVAYGGTGTDTCDAERALGCEP
jgi:Ca2+-binding RTX toxin-like protein